jgi:hypothetical protein
MDNIAAIRVLVPRLDEVNKTAHVNMVKATL